MRTEHKESFSIPDFLSHLILQLNIPLSAHEDFNKNMQRTLKTVGEFSGHERIHILEINHNMTYTVLYEWCDRSLPPLAEKLKHNVLFYDPRLQKQLCSQSYILVHVQDTAQHPLFQAWLQAENCQQMLVLPLFESGTHFAFITFMQCNKTHEWSKPELQFLQDVSSIIATQLNNYQQIKQLLQQIKQYRKRQQRYDILCSQLKKLHKEFIPVWNEIKNSLPSGIHYTQLKQYINTLDKICRPLSGK